MITFLIYYLEVAPRKILNLIAYKKLSENI